MATVLQRFEHLGLAHNNKILMIVGDHIAKKFKEQGWSFQNPIMGGKVKQIEGNEVFYVWDYPEFWNKEMDKQILLFLDHYLDLKVDVRNG